MYRSPRRSVRFWAAAFTAKLLLLAPSKDATLFYDIHTKTGASNHIIERNTAQKHKNTLVALSHARTRVWVACSNSLLGVLSTPPPVTALRTQNQSEGHLARIMKQGKARCGLHCPAPPFPGPPDPLHQDARPPLFPPVLLVLYPIKPTGRRTPAAGCVFSLSSDPVPADLPINQ